MDLNNFMKENKLLIVGRMLPLGLGIDETLKLTHQPVISHDTP